MTTTYTYKPYTPRRPVAGFNTVTDASTGGYNPLRMSMKQYGTGAPLSAYTGGGQVARQNAATPPINVQPLVVPAAAKPPTPPPATSTPNGNQGGQDQTQAPGGQGQFDISSDPILAKIKALAGQSASDAIAGGDALRKQLLIQYGSPDLARQAQFGDPNAPTTGDATTADAAAKNPFSTLAQLVKQHEQQQQGIDLNTNKSNLFYSSTRGNQLQQEGQDYLQNRSNAEGQVRGALADVVSQILQTQADNRNRIADEQGNATQRAIQAAIQNGYTFSGFDQNGNPILTLPKPAQNPADQTGTPPPATDTGAPLNGYPGLVAALTSAEANAARRKGQRGEYLNLYG